MIIYKIQNLINGKCYIGQTIQKMNNRFLRHKHEAFSKNTESPLYNAMRKYGIHNFKITEIDGANNITELNYREFIHIHKLNSICPNGYNIKEGGGNLRTPVSVRNKISKTLKKTCDKDRLMKMTIKSLKTTRKKVIVEDTKTGDIKVYESVKSTSKLGSHKHINAILSGKRPYKIFKNRYWFWYEGEKNRRGLN